MEARTPAGIYIRVSTEEQHAENQLPSLERMAAARGFDVVEVYRDDGISGTKGKRDRPGLTKLYLDAARGRIRAVLVWALDRFSRDDTFAGGCLMIGELDHFRCALLSHDETWLDTSGPFREPLVALSLKMAASERNKLVGRTKEGMARAKAEGIHIGRPRVLMSDALLDRALEFRRRGYTWRSVSRELEKEGFTVATKTGVKRPNFATLQRMVTARVEQLGVAARTKGPGKTVRGAP